MYTHVGLISEFDQWGLKSKGDQGVTCFDSCHSPSSADTALWAALCFWLKSISSWSSILKNNPHVTQLIEYESNSSSSKHYGTSSNKCSLQNVLETLYVLYYTFICISGSLWGLNETRLEWKSVQRVKQSSVNKWLLLNEVCLLLTG